jgi:hypothetical protein
VVARAEPLLISGRPVLSEALLCAAGGAVKERVVFAEAGSRVVSALLALPRWLAALSRLERRPGIGRALLGFVLAVAATGAAIVLVFALARAIYYPFWAAGASRDELERSWGGPGAVGATVVHWLVAALTIVVMYLAILGTERLRRT